MNLCIFFIFDKNSSFLYPFSIDMKSMNSPLAVCRIATSFEIVFF